MERTCTKCGATKELELFVKSVDCRDGRCNTCKVCRAAHARAWKKKNPEQFRATKRKAYRKNPEPQRACARAYYRKNKDRLKAARLARKDETNDATHN